MVCQEEFFLSFFYKIYFFFFHFLTDFFEQNRTLRPIFLNRTIFLNLKKLFFLIKQTLFLNFFLTFPPTLDHGHLFNNNSDDDL